MDCILRIAWFPAAPFKCRCWRRRRRQRGTATVEHVVLLTTAALGLSVAVVAVGVPLVQTYGSRTALLGPASPVVFGKMARAGEKSGNDLPPAADTKSKGRRKV